MIKVFWIMIPFISLTVSLPTPQTSQQTTEEKCLPLPAPAHGTILPYSFHGEKQRMMVTCYEGYTYRGPEVLICLDNHKWSGKLGSCTETARIRCPKPKLGENVLIDYEKLVKSTAISLYCPPGYTFSGSASAICQEDGTWTDFPASCTGENKDYIIVIPSVLGAAGLVITITVTAVICWRRKKRNHESIETPTKKEEEPEPKKVDVDPKGYLNEANRRTFEKFGTPVTWVTLGPKLGEGHHGLVHKGTMMKGGQPADEVQVALKTMKGDAKWTPPKLNEFLQEATIMQGFEHPNVLALLGITIIEKQLYVILPYMGKGDLKTFISNETFDLKVSIKILLDAAQGLDYLSGRNFVHRDVAARNCMLSDSLELAVCDFGLSRDLHSKDYYSPSDTTKPMPLRWMAPESLEDFQFTTMSDIWSYGVMMWEVSTKGDHPYAHIRPADLVNFLKMGNRLKKPSDWPMALFQLQLDCWSFEADLRPTFGKLVRRLRHMLANVDELSKTAHRKSTTASGPGTGGGTPAIAQPVTDSKPVVPHLRRREPVPAEANRDRPSESIAVVADVHRQDLVPDNVIFHPSSESRAVVPHIGRKDPALAIDPRSHNTGELPSGSEGGAVGGFLVDVQPLIENMVDLPLSETHDTVPLLASMHGSSDSIDDVQLPWVGQRNTVQVRTTPSKRVEDLILPCAGEEKQVSVPPTSDTISHTMNKSSRSKAETLGPPYVPPISHGMPDISHDCRPDPVPVPAKLHAPSHTMGKSASGSETGAMDEQWVDVQSEIDGMTDTSQSHRKNQDIVMEPGQKRPDAMTLQDKNIADRLTPSNEKPAITHASGRVPHPRHTLSDSMPYTHETGHKTIHGLGYKPETGNIPDYVPAHFPAPATLSTPITIPIRDARLHTPPAPIQASTLVPALRLVPLFATTSVSAPFTAPASSSIPTTAPSKMLDPGYCILTDPKQNRKQSTTTASRLRPRREPISTGSEMELLPLGATDDFEEYV